MSYGDEQMPIGLYFRRLLRNVDGLTWLGLSIFAGLTFFVAGLLANARKDYE